MSCQVTFPLQDIVLLLRDKISPEIIGAVPEEKLEEEVLLFIQPKIDELQEQLSKLPPEVHVVTQALQGSVLETTLNDGKVLTSDLSPLFTKIVSDRLSNTIQTFNTLEAGVDPVTGVADGAYFNVRSSNDESYVDEYQNVGGVATPSGKSYPSRAAKWSDDQIITENGEKQRQLNNRLKKNLLSSFGAIPDDPTKAVQNREALIAASRAGTVIIDGHYEIDATPQNDFTTSLKWVSAPNGGSVNFTGTISNFIRFDSVDHIIIEGIRITSTQQSGVLMSLLNPLAVINTFKFSGELLTGIRFFSGEWSGSVDPSVQWYGVKHISVKDFHLENSKTAFSFVNCPCDLIEYKDGTIKNMSFCPLYIGVANAHPFGGIVRRMQTYFIASNVVTRNDDDFWSSEGGGAYFCVALFEGLSATVKNCVTEGLKSRDVKALYDFYISTLDPYIYEENIWKNNICFNSAKMNNELMKAKSSPISTHTKNTFIVEKDFVLRHATDPQSQGWVTLYEKVEGDDRSRLVIENNTFDVYMLLGMSSSSRTKNIHFKNNDFRIGILAASLINIRNFDTGATTLADADVIVCGNDFEIDEIGRITRNSTTYGDVYFMRMNYTADSPLGTYREIRANKNTFNIKKLTTDFWMFSGLKANILNLDDNTLNSFDPTTTTQLRPYEAVGDAVFNLSAKNQVVNTTTGLMNSGALNTIVSGTASSALEYIVDSAHSLNSISILPPTGELLVRVGVSMIGPRVGTASAFYNLKLTSTGVQYTDVDGVLKTVTYPEEGQPLITINPKVYQAPGDSALKNIRCTIRSLSYVLGVLTINLSPTDVYSGVRHKSHITVNTLAVR